MSAVLYQLAQWRSDVWLEGLTLRHRRARVLLTRADARALAESIDSALLRGGQHAAAGFVVRSPHVRRVILEGFPSGAITFTRGKAAELGLALARAARVGEALP